MFIYIYIYIFFFLCSFPSLLCFTFRRKVPGLRIYLRKGRRLVARDDNGRSDPFVTFSITGERNSVKCKSSVINRTLNPIWNEEFFIAVKHLTGAKLTIEVRDKDRGLAGKVIKSDYMGSATISLNQYAPPIGRVSCFACLLRPSIVSSPEPIFLHSFFFSSFS